MVMSQKISSCLNIFLKDSHLIIICLKFYHLKLVEVFIKNLHLQINELNNKFLICIKFIYNLKFIL